MQDDTNELSSRKSHIAFHIQPPEQSANDSDTTSSPVHLSQPSSPRTPSPFIEVPSIGTSASPILEDSVQDNTAAGNKSERESLDSEPEAWEVDADQEEEGMPSDLRPPYSRQHDGKSNTPLLKGPGDQGPDYHGSGRPGLFSSPRRSTFHERDPDLEAKSVTRRRYTTAGAFLLLSLVAFTIQTETAVYIQHNLRWEKPYCMLWLTHGSWSLLWPAQLLILRLQKWHMPWKTFWRRHLQILRQTGQMVEHRELHLSGYASKKSPVPYMLRTTVVLTSALTVAGGSWYYAVNMTTASDLTAIYNCSAFFAYAFAIPILNDKFRWGKAFAVTVAIAGVLVVAYGDASPAKHGGKSGGGAGGRPPADETDFDPEEGRNRFLGNMVIGVGSVLYGFYEVLYKKVACPPDGCSPGRGTIFANAVGSLIGCFTLLVLWIPLPVLHVTGLETFELPRGKAAWMLLISVLANATFSGSFLVLISLTSPVLSSVAALLTIFLVALVDQVLPPPLNTPLSSAAIAGGCLIIAAFFLLTWFTYREMDEERRKKMEEVDSDDEDEN